ncbi:protein kinase, partial [Trypanosoma cruzi]
VDNTSLQGAANRGSSKSHALTRELQRIHELLDSRGIQATFAYVRPAGNPTDGISRGRVCFYTSGLGEGVELVGVSGGVLWLEDPKVCHLVINKYIFCRNGVSRATIEANVWYNIYTITRC